MGFIKDLFSLKKNIKIHKDANAKKAEKKAAKAETKEAE